MSHRRVEFGLWNDLTLLDQNSEATVAVMVIIDNETIAVFLNRFNI